MADLDTIIELSHELRGLQQIQLDLEYSIKKPGIKKENLLKVIEILSRHAQRLEALKKRLSDIANQNNVCLKNCANRQMFEEREEKDAGCWP